jgi:hypothetical protein
MALVACKNQDCKTDTSLYCFTNKDGKHVSPRQCICVGYAPARTELLMSKWPEVREAYAQRNKQRVAQGKKPVEIPHYITREQWKQVTLEKKGKLNPNCPIEDAHSPISQKWVA